MIRKFFTVLASVIFFGNSLVTRQWIGTVFVFAGGHKLKNSVIVIIRVCQNMPKSFFVSGIFLDGLYGKQKAPDAKTSKD